MRVIVLNEARGRERRVALTPAAAATLVADGHTVHLETGAGAAAGFPDDLYRSAGADVGERAAVLGSDGVVVAVGAGPDDAGPGHAVVGLLDPLWRPAAIVDRAGRGTTLLSLELVPRITRAQSMDVLSSMALVAGDRAALLAATELPRMMPLMMTAAGTVPPARVLVLGAGVAGLQAIATSKRLGAVVRGYDVRPAAAEQIRSLGAKAVELDLDTSDSEDAGGYATAQTDEQAERQREQLAAVIADSDAVISTAAIPGARSPLLVTESAVEAMAPGSVIVDLAAERGGNCALTIADEIVDRNGVRVLGPTDLTSRVPRTASQLFATNVVNLVRHLSGDDRALVLDTDDEITAGILVARDGAVVNDRVVAAAQTGDLP